MKSTNRTLHLVNISRFAIQALLLKICQNFEYCCAVSCPTYRFTENLKRVTERNLFNLLVAISDIAVEGKSETAVQ